MFTSTTDVIAYAIDHIDVIGWPVVVTMAWKLRGAASEFFTKWNSMDNRTVAIESIAVKTAANVNAIQTNHLAHIEESLIKQQAFQEKTLEVLTSIDKGIAVLVDRGK